MGWKTITSSGVGALILAMVILLNYPVADNTYFCGDEPYNLVDCLSLSGGLGTRCYLNEEKNSWDVCKTGWVRVKDHIEYVEDSEDFYIKNDVVLFSGLGLSIPNATGHDWAFVEKNITDEVTLEQRSKRTGEVYPIINGSSEVSLNTFTYFVTELEKTISCTPVNQYLQSCEIVSWNFDKFENKMKENVDMKKYEKYLFREVIPVYNDSLDLSNEELSIEGYNIVFKCPGNLTCITDLDPEVEVTYTTTTSILNPQNVTATTGGVKLTPTNSTGSFDSWVFYNSTSTYWNTTLSHNATAGNNVTLETRTATSYNVSDANLMGFWGFNNNFSGTVIDQESATIYGTWTLYSSGGYNNNMRYDAAGTAADKLQYAFSPTEDGNYYFWTTWLYNANRCPDAPYTVEHDGGTTTVDLDQRTGGDSSQMWHLIGNYTLTGGNSYDVNLSHDCTGYVSADAILMVKEEDSFKDESGQYPAICYNETGTDRCPVIDTDGIVDDSYNFDGVNDVVDVNSITTIPDDFTISFWMNPDDYTIVGHYPRVIHWVENSTKDLEIIPDEAANDFVAGFPSGGGNFGVKTSSPPLNEWTHVVVTRSSSDIDVYFNGKNMSTTSQVPGDAVPTGPATFRIGSDMGALVPNGFYDGGIDEVRVYNKTLTPADVQNLYEIGSYHLEWTAWQDEGKMTDGVADTSTAGGNFMQFRANLKTNDTDVSAYILNHSVTYAESPVSNTAPNNPTANLLSVDDSNTTSANLNVSGITSDPDGDATDLYVFWYKNDTLNLSYFVNGDYANNTQYDSLLLSGNLTVGDVWIAGIIANDGTDNSSQVNSSSLAIIPIPETTLPYFTTIPANVSVDYLDAWGGTTFVGTDADSLPVGYFIDDTNNFTINQTGYLNWTGGGLNASTYEVNVSVNDTAGNVNSTIWKMIVNKITPNPISYIIISDPLSPVTFGTLTTVRGINIITELDSSYKLYRNTTLVSNPDIQTLNASTYNYTFNSTGNNNYNPTTVSQLLVVNKKNPSTQVLYINNSETNYSNIISGTTDNDIYINASIDDTVAEAGAYNFTVNLNGTQIINKVFYTTSVNAYSLRNLSLGYYNVTLNFTGTPNYNPVTIVRWINITEESDDTAPTWTFIPDNATLEFHVDTLGVNFTATDEIELDTYFINDTGNFSINETGWLTNITVLPLGTYIINVSVNDTSNNVNSTIYQVVVNDSLNPYWSVLPSNISVLDIATIVESFTVIELGELDSCWLNDTSMITANTTNYYNISTLVSGDYAYNLSCNDTSSNINSTFFTVEINNTISPNDPEPVLISSDGTRRSTIDLNCSSVLTGNNSAILNLTTSWYKNSVLNLTQDFFNIVNGTNFTVNLTSGNLTAGDTWICGMNLSDGALVSNQVNSSSLIILDATDRIQVWQIFNITSGMLTNVSWITTEGKYCNGITGVCSG